MPSPGRPSKGWLAWPSNCAKHMVGIRYIRRDRVIHIHRRADRRIVVELHDGARSRARILPVRQSERADETLSISELASLLFDTSRIRAELASWKDVHRGSLKLPPSSGGAEHQLDRVCLRIDDERLAGLPIEQALRRALGEKKTGGPPIPRLIPLPARVAQVPFTLPLRFLQLDPRSDFHLGQTVRNVFRSHVRKRDFASVMQVEEGSSRGFSRWSLPSGWRTVDVLHLDRLAVRSKNRLLAMSAPEEVGTLGWLARCVDLWRTRLVVIRRDVNTEMCLLRRFAHRLAAQGGPTVWLVDAETPGLAARLRKFYEMLVHDTPIDLAAAIAARSAPRDPANDTLIVGSGREELVRVSALGDRIADLAGQLSDPDPVVRAESAGRLWSSIADSGVDLDEAVANFTTAVRGLAGIANRLPTMQFDVHEADGVVPLGRSMGTLRRSMPKPAGPVRDVRVVLDRSGPRFVNPSLWRIDAATGDKEPISQRAQLQRGRPIIFGVQLGPRDSYAPVLDAIAIVEEPFKWSEGQEGVWLSVGITGLDFTVIGAAIQQVWLPRQGASDLVEFLVEPTRTGVSQLRFCVYFGADLLQSHRLAALVVESPSEAEAEASAGAGPSLANALGVPTERVGAVGWLARMEYVAAANLAAPPVGRDVALSVFANNLDGRRVFTTRGSEGFAVLVAGDTSQRVDDVRKQLDAASRDKSNFYAFRERENVPPHSGTPDQRDAVLQSLARVGRILFDAIFKEADQDILAADLAGKQRVIHVAHSLLENVIPWAVIYDRPYDANRRRDDAGLPVLRAVCPAGLPNAGGQFVADSCGTHPNCLLSPQKKQAAAAAGQGAADDTIVCARHFWGFRHIIEIPPWQQDETVTSTSATAAPAMRWTATSAGKPASLLLGYNGALATVEAHRTELDELVKKPRKVSAVWRNTNQRDAFLKYLRQGPADLVYLFCHARGGAGDPTGSPPALEFQETATSQPDLIDAADFRGVKLANHPLVFLNGCNTAAFSPDALSPFIRKLVRDCDVAGVIGTEIPVFEPLAGEMATQFLTRFLDGDEAGKAILESRLDLLARGNPLGLVYTLYAAAELALVQ